LLDFDNENPRLIAADGNHGQAAILKTLWSEFAVAEIALSIAANGYFDYEPLFAIQAGTRLKVIEGNRRLAAVKLLVDRRLREKVGATDLPEINKAAKEKLGTLPVIVCTREQVWQYLGFKHVNGPQDWSSEAKAEYIARVHNKWGVPLVTIANTIGD